MKPHTVYVRWAGLVAWLRDDFGLSVYQVRKLLRDGRIQPVRLLPGQRAHYHVESIQSALHEHR